MVQHPAPDELLLDYATGNLAEPVALLVASHLTLAPESRREVRDLEAIGGALLEEMEPASMSEDALDSVLARLGEHVPESFEAGEPGVPAGPPSGDAAKIPAPLRALVGSDLSSLPWRERGGSVAECDILRDAPGYRTRLLWIKAGAKVPTHTHGGREYTLVLQGSFSDESGRFGRGDVEVADAEVTHRPVAGSECDCICLAVTDAPLRMTGPIGRLLNYFIDM
ncbi:ChrR family anti-sigma-E factor [Ferruginivarius sediminum]|uniref:Anti-sigma factor n=1 Tax=Ferruginivarius sediminum TaxID=2661937 RepID=A0A369T7U8_9PROT|nr:ChrR family anti-sigma-E factor [Ferruginivarius sediminum]RDD61393.1 anti-sigma factor [Ferruginivarius sediminum]